MAKNKKPTETSFTKKTIGSCIAAIAALGAMFGVDKYIEYKIQNQMQDERVIKKLQTFVRPSILFDQTGAVLSDQGAWQFIEDLKVSRDKEGFVDQIIVTLKNLSSSPILTCLDSTVQYSISKVRGKKFDIIYELDVISHSEPRTKTSLFSLEMTYGDSLQSDPRPKSQEKVFYFPGKIVSECMDIIRRPGNTKLNVSMAEDPTYKANEGDTYYNTRNHSYMVFSNGKWRKLSFVDEP